MRRRRFIALLAAALLTPPEPVRQVLEQRLPKLKPIRLVAFEMIGISICNVDALQRVSFNVDPPNKPRDILPA